MSNHIEHYRSLLKHCMPMLKQRYAVSTLELFGSRVRNEHRPESDLDVLVKFDVAPSLFKLVEMENELSDRLGIKVDLVVKESLKPHIGRRILQEVISI